MSRRYVQWEQCTRLAAGCMPLTLRYSYEIRYCLRLQKRSIVPLGGAHSRSRCSNDFCPHVSCALLSRWRLPRQRRAGRHPRSLPACLPSCSVPPQYLGLRYRARKQAASTMAVAVAFRVAGCRSDRLLAITFHQITKRHHLSARNGCRQQIGRAHV